MKTTVKLSQSLRATVQPCKGTGGVLLEITHGLPFSSQSSEAMHFTPDQWGALMAGGQFALETMQGATAERHRFPRIAASLEAMQGVTA